MKSNISDIIEALDDRYFWDVDTSKPQPKASKRLIIERVFSLGSVEDIRKVISFYGRKEVANVLSEVKYLDPKTLNFVSILFDKPKESFRCYTPTSSTPRYWNS